MTDAPLILVVDDIEDNRYALTRRLKREGYERVIEATNGREALDKLESEIGRASCRERVSRCV